MKEYECVQVNRRRDVSGMIMEWQKNGWRLCTYQATGYGADVKHYLLFEEGSKNCVEEEGSVFKCY